MSVLKHSNVVADGWFPRDYEMNAFTLFGLIPCVSSVGFTSREIEGITYWWGNRWRADGRTVASVRLSRPDMPDMSTTCKMSDKTRPDMSGKKWMCPEKKLNMFLKGEMSHMRFVTSSEL